LSLLLMGAKRDTHKQLFQTLGYSDFTSAQVSEAYEHLQHMLSHSQGALQLDTGSTLVLQEGFKPTQKYLEDAKHYFQAEGFTVDFKKQDLALQEINKYIAKKTHDKIPEVMSSVDSDTLLVLLNYIFFRGRSISTHLMIDIFMPKFSASGSYSLKEVLTEMGVVAAFSDSADLSGISEEVGLKVSKVSHKAVLNVDEKGTEAAAATTIEIMPMSLPDTFVLDRPFLLLIVEESTRSILFMGKVVNPTAS
ncbi:alpha-1-antitrypsin homolog, partial [Megalops cyprinoides]|uniref:alpha-1-antitrypsin homolog n=1 Tax=Megalops cyprinoides TaxID=118141 RepID=UPI0018652FAF